MNTKFTKDIAQLSKDLYENSNLVFNNVSGQDVMRDVIRDILGIEEGASQSDMYYAFKKNQVELFQVISVAVDAVLPTILKNQFDGFTRFHTLQLGDTFRFENTNTDLFRVARIASGTQDLRRQVNLPSHYSIETDWYGASVYTELEQFLTGMVDWNGYIKRLADSFAHFIGARIYEAITQSYDALRANLKHQGTLEIDKLVELSSLIKALAGSTDVTIYGTPAAISKVVAKMELSPSMLDEFNRTGVVGQVRGVKLSALPQAVKPGTDEFALDDDSLLIVPSGDKIVDVVLEGPALTNEIDALDDNGLQMTYRTMKKLGFGVRQAAVYGIYKTV